ncbi:hydrolase [Rickenella mellea]|uniref:Hydrolase n=1 Tax=Rickenella mellea TaxID=50990 RepID=A0A4Y7PS00_9AGAM|nr:hydrolase [Rickenella mellea]
MSPNKKRNVVPPEQFLRLPEYSNGTPSPIVDTHSHLLSTFASYRSLYPDGQYEDVFDFMRGMYDGKGVESMVDVWCEAPVQKEWKELADSALSEELRKEKWNGIEYWFVMGEHAASVHQAKDYNDTVEADILEAMRHPRCVGWGEIGLDYHYDNSPRDIQRQVFTRQLENAVKLGKPLTIHTREAEEDTERILKETVPKDHKIHVHCFTDSADFADRLLDWFPNLYIGITGVITYATNQSTSEVIRRLSAKSKDTPLRILLETDAPYMVPGNLYKALPTLKGRLPICHTAMIPWTAEFVAGVAGEGFDTERVLKEARENARRMYGV